MGKKILEKRNKRRKPRMHSLSHLQRLKHLRRNKSMKRTKITLMSLGSTWLSPLEKENVLKWRKLPLVKSSEKTLDIAEEIQQKISEIAKNVGIPSLLRKHFIDTNNLDKSKILTN